MPHWLMKTDPDTYAWADLVREGKTRWDGVRNFQARNHLRAMRPGDLALIYHSQSERAILGVARVVSAPYADPTAKEGDWTAVDVEPACSLREPVCLDRVKGESALRDMALLKQSRLSVQPVTPAQFDRIVAIGGRAALASGKDFRP